MFLQLRFFWFKRKFHRNEKDFGIHTTFYTHQTCWLFHVLCFTQSHFFHKSSSLIYKNSSFDKFHSGFFPSRCTLSFKIPIPDQQESSWKFVALISLSLKNDDSVSMLLSSVQFEAQIASYF